MCINIYETFNQQSCKKKKDFLQRHYIIYNLKQAYIVTGKTKSHKNPKY